MQQTCNSNPLKKENHISTNNKNFCHDTKKMLTKAALLARL